MSGIQYIFNHWYASIIGCSRKKEKINKSSTSFSIRQNKKEEEKKSVPCHQNCFRSSVEIVLRVERYSGTLFTKYKAADFQVNDFVANDAPNIFAFKHLK